LIDVANVMQQQSDRLPRTRVLHVTPSYFPAHKFGGPIQSVLLLNRYLPNDIDLEVYSTNAGLQSDASITPNVVNTKLGHPVTYYSFIGPDNYNFSPRLLWALLKNVRRFDVVHITAVWNFPVIAACLACWLFSKPYLLSPRGTIYPETVAMRSSLFKRVYYLLLAKWCLRWAKRIHYTSADEQVRVERYLGLSNGCLIANGIELSALQKRVDGRPIEADYVLYLGRLDQKKGIDWLIEGFAKVRLQHPGLHLVIAGPDAGGYQMHLQQQVQAQGIADAVHFVGQVTGDEKLRWYQHAKLFALTSHSENFGMTVVEAMASATPVLISSGVGISPQVLAADAGVVVDMQPFEIAEKLLWAIEHPEQMRQKAENAQRMIRAQFQIESVSAAMADCYRQLAGR
jgi:glycosyltransferase involved in cell wall biosynthesis